MAVRAPAAEFDFEERQPRGTFLSHHGSPAASDGSASQVGSGDRHALLPPDSNRDSEFGAPAGCHFAGAGADEHRSAPGSATEPGQGGCDAGWRTGEDRGGSTANIAV